MICMVECKDSIKNLKKVLNPVKEQIDKLANMTWNGKTIKLFLFGDYDFFTKNCMASLEPRVFIHVSGAKLQSVRYRNLQHSSQPSQPEV